MIRFARTWLVEDAADATAAAFFLFFFLDFDSPSDTDIAFILSHSFSKITMLRKKNIFILKWLFIQIEHYFYIILLLYMFDIRKLLVCISF